jgi:hypothetical protein
MKSLLPTDRRQCPDRRAAPTSIWDTLLGRGLRIWHRRQEQRSHPHFVDRFANTWLVLAITLLLMSIVDAVITIQLLPSGCVEFNPLMAWLLERGILSFVVGKYILTAAGLPVLLVFKNSRLFGSRFPVEYVLHILVCLYVVLLVYQIHLLRLHT